MLIAQMFDFMTHLRLNRYILHCFTILVLMYPFSPTHLLCIVCPGHIQIVQSYHNYTFPLIQFPCVTATEPLLKGSHCEGAWQLATWI